MSKGISKGLSKGKGIWKGIWKALRKGLPISQILHLECDDFGLVAVEVCEDQAWPHLEGLAEGSAGFAQKGLLVCGPEGNSDCGGNSDDNSKDEAIQILLTEGLRVSFVE